MFVINKDSNSISPLIRRSFNELGFRERSNLQEWIAGNPDCLGENLLIIQKEFSGFSETNERLDLLALDKGGNLVIIENKLDDSGRDVTWQALKYASYASTLKKEDIRTIYQDYLNSQASGKNAVQMLQDFFHSEDYAEISLNQRITQRIILVAANFRKEVTSTVLWLMNFKIQIQCFKATPYELNEQYFLTLDQIIPTKDAQDYVISMTNKAQEEITTNVEVKTRHTIRLKFWAEFLKKIKGSSNLFQNSNPTKDHWLVAGGTGIRHASFQAIITYASSTVMLNFGSSSVRENKLLFDFLFQHKSEIEASFGESLIWERLDDKISSRLSSNKTGINYFNEEDWPEIIDFLISNLNKLEKAVKPYLPEIRQQLLSSIKDIQDLEVSEEEIILN